MVKSGHAPLSECPYRAALSAFEFACQTGVRIEAPGAVLRFVGGTPEAREQLRPYAGVMTFSLRSIEGREAYDGFVAVDEAARLIGVERLRLKVEGSTLTVVDLHDPLRRALTRIVRAPDLAAREALTMTAEALRLSPLPWTLELLRTPTDEERKRWSCERTPFVVTTSQASYKAAVAARKPAFVARELEAAALAVEVERAWPRDLDMWLNAKKRGEWRLTPDLTGALDVQGVSEATKGTWALGRVLDALGCELVSFETHERKAGK